MSVSVAMIALSSEDVPSFFQIAEELISRWPDLSVEEDWHEEDGEEETESEDDSEVESVFFTVDGERAFVALMPGPIPWSDLEGPCATSILWEEASEAMKSHRAHLVVSIMSDLSPIEESVLLTQVMAATTAACSSAIGIYYGNSTLVMEPSMFIDFAEFLPEEFPLFIWVDFRVGGNDEGSTSGFTAGMTALGHMEIESQNASDEVGEFRERLFGLCQYLLENGPVIRNGHTVGADAQEKIKVVYGKSAFGHEDAVMRLVYEPADKKPWWKFF